MSSVDDHIRRAHGLLLSNGPPGCCKLREDRTGGHLLFESAPVSQSFAHIPPLPAEVGHEGREGCAPCPRLSAVRSLFSFTARICSNSLVRDSRRRVYRASFSRRSFLSGDTNSDPLPPVLIPTPIMPSCYRLSTPLSGSFLVFTSVSRWVCSGSTFVNLDRINPLFAFSRSR